MIAKDLKAAVKTAVPATIVTLKRLHKLVCKDIYIESDSSLYDGMQHQLS